MPQFLDSLNTSDLSKCHKLTVFTYKGFCYVKPSLGVFFTSEFLLSFKKDMAPDHSTSEVYSNVELKPRANCFFGTNRTNRIQPWKPWLMLRDESAFQTALQSSICALNHSCVCVCVQIRGGQEAVEWHVKRDALCIWSLVCSDAPQRCQDAQTLKTASFQVSLPVQVPFDPSTQLCAWGQKASSWLFSYPKRNKTIELQMCVFMYVWPWLYLKSHTFTVSTVKKLLINTWMILEPGLLETFCTCKSHPTLCSRGSRAFRGYSSLKCLTLQVL